MNNILLGLKLALKDGLAVFQMMMYSSSDFFLKLRQIDHKELLWQSWFIIQNQNAEFNVFIKNCWLGTSFPALFMALPSKSNETCIA